MCFAESPVRFLLFDIYILLDLLRVSFNNPVRKTLPFTGRTPLVKLGMRTCSEINTKYGILHIHKRPFVVENKFHSVALFHKSKLIRSTDCRNSGRWLSLSETAHGVLMIQHEQTSERVKNKKTPASVLLCMVKTGHSVFLPMTYEP